VSIKEIVAMPERFDQGEVEKLLVACHRRCCLCHSYCGVKIETHHIDPERGREIENAIPLCFNCHSEVRAYDPSHPRGRKFTPEELRRHRAQWLDICKNHPAQLVAAPYKIEVGPLNALIDELEFNSEVARQAECVVADKPNPTYATLVWHCPKFSETQFERAISEGAVSMLEPNLKKKLLAAYALIRNANVIGTEFRARFAQSVLKVEQGEMTAALQVAHKEIDAARRALLSFLRSDESAPLEDDSRSAPTP
jgi:hypothetical protein